MAEDSWNDLNGFARAIEEAGKLKEKERLEFNARLGLPAVFVPDADDARLGIGYWKAEGGVVAYRKYVNGYDPFSRVEYPDSLIDILNKVR